jgi:type IV pilus assembly protein PilN
MIKINLLAVEKKSARAKAPGAPAVAASGSMQAVLLGGIVLVTVLGLGWWWWSLSSEKTRWTEQNAADDQELARLEQIRKKGDEFKSQVEVLNAKVSVISQLRKNQAVPVHILDQVSRSLPDFLWLESMHEQGNALSIRGKATNFNAVANFYNNLSASEWFKNVIQGAIQEAPEGVSFTLTCDFVPPKETEEGAAEGAGANPAAAPPAANPGTAASQDAKAAPVKQGA